MSTFFENIKSTNVSFFTLIIIVVISIAIIFFLGAVIIYLYRKIKDLTKMRYGFGGKPIFSLLIVLCVIVTIPLTFYASQKSIETVKIARAQKDVLVEIQSVKLYDDVYSVAFMAVPTIDGEPWQGKEYDITWQVYGEVSFEKVEKERSLSSPSYFVNELKNGSYEVRVTVESKDFRVVKTEELVLD
jgi:amino acid transporter